MRGLIFFPSAALKGSYRVFRSETKMQATSLMTDPWEITVQRISSTDTIPLYSDRH